MFALLHLYMKNIKNKDTVLSYLINNSKVKIFKRKKKNKRRQIFKVKKKSLKKFKV